MLDELERLAAEHLRNRNHAPRKRPGAPAALRDRRLHRPWKDARTYCSSTATAVGRFWYSWVPYLAATTGRATGHRGLGDRRPIST